MVPPDSALVAATVASSRGSKAEAVRAAAAGLDSLTADLAARAGWRWTPAPDGGR